MDSTDLTLYTIKASFTIVPASSSPTLDEDEDRFDRNRYRYDHMSASTILPTYHMIKVKNEEPTSAFL